MYTLAIYLYTLGILLVSPFHRKARAMIKGRFKTFITLRKKIDKNKRYVWFHAASLGEFEQGRSLMERFRSLHPEYQILLTFFSPSGYEVRKNYEGADIVCYLPMDTPGNVASFLRLVKPEMAFFIKYEFWYNIIHSCYKHGIPVYSVSSIFRSNKVFFRWYGAGYARVLKMIAHFFVQDEESARLLALKGIKDNVTIVGDTRFDRVLDICHRAKDLPMVEAFVSNADKVLVVGSSWQPDESLIIPYFNKHSRLKLILVPHVIGDDRIRQIKEKIKRPCVCYTDAQVDTVADADCLIVNCYGLLSSIYRYGHIAYVGGGFGVGIHNVPEAAVHGVPVLIGPNNKGFREAQDLLRMGGCFEITGSTLFNAVMDRLMEDDSLRQIRGAIGHKYVASNSGATDMIFRTLGL